MVMNTEPSETLGCRIKSVRIAWGWSQEKLAYAIQVNQASISYWEQDRITPSGSAMVALVALFGCTLSSILTGVEWAIPEAHANIPAFKHLSGFAKSRLAKYRLSKA
jgi:DNA-binding XRE family transcriptional regulator